MAYQLQTFSPPPIPPELQNARTFQQLRESIKHYLGLLTKFHNDSFKTVVANANQNAQGAGVPIASAASITVTNAMHIVTGTATVDTITAPKGFQGQLMLMSQDGFSIANTGNISNLEPLNYLGPGSFMHFTFHPNVNRWYGDGCRLMDTAGAIGGKLIIPTGSALNQLLRSLGPTSTPGWTTATFPPDVATGDLLYGSAASAWSRLADVAVGSYLRSGGAGAAPLWSTLKLPNAAVTGDLLLATAANTIGSLADVAVNQVLASGGVGAPPAYTATPIVTNLTATGTVQGATVTATGTLSGATLNVTTHVTQGGGLKHQRVTTGSIAASSSADVTLSWTAAFADANYTVTASVVEAGANLEVVTIKSAAAGSIVVTVRNTDAGAPHTGTLQAIAMHD